VTNLKALNNKMDRRGCVVSQLHNRLTRIQITPLINVTFFFPRQRNVRGPSWLLLNWSFADVRFLHKSAHFARQFIMFGHPVTIAVLLFFDWPAYVTPTATEYAAVVRVLAASSSSRRAEVGWALGVRKGASGHLALWTSLAWRAVIGYFELRLVINRNP
jgi:hypothetical protein